MSFLNKKLLPPLHADETASSLCSRTAFICGRSVTDFCLDMGTRFRDVANGHRKALSTIGRVCHRDPDALLRHNAIRVDSHNFNWNGQIIHRIGLDRLKMRVCVECLKEDLTHDNCALRVRPYLRADWTVSGVRTCERHARSLIALSVKFAYGAPRDTATVLAEFVDRLDELTLECVDQNFTSFEHFLLSKIRGEQAVVSNWLNELRVDVAMRVCEMIGLVAAEGAWAARKQLDEHQLYHNGESGFQLINAEPDLTSLLDQLVADCAKRRHYPSVPNVMGCIWKNYATRTSDEGFNPFHDRLREYALKNLPVGRGDDAFGIVDTPRKRHSIRTAAEQFDLNHEQMGKLVVASGLGSVDDVKTPSNSFCFDAAEIEQFMERVKAGIRNDDAMDYLNVPISQETGLLKAKLLVPLVVRGQWGHHLFEKQALDKFLERLFQNATPVQECGPGYSNIALATRQAKTNSVVIVRLLFERKLAKVQRLEAERGFLSLLVNAEEISAILHKPDDRGYTSSQLMIALNASSETVRRLIDRGYLPAARLRNTKTGILGLNVSPADLQEFQERYVSSTELARMLRLPVFQVLNWCRNHGLNPAFDPATIGSHYFLREVVPRI
ncbi:TniQ family protein [Phyllobacterium sophorae]|nr:TniQ family protein [Phyllobacterium sophorae]